MGPCRATASALDAINDPAPYIEPKIIAADKAVRRIEGIRRPIQGICSQRRLTISTRYRAIKAKTSGMRKERATLSIQKTAINTAIHAAVVTIRDWGINGLAPCVCGVMEPIVGRGRSGPQRRGR